MMQQLGHFPFILLISGLFPGVSAGLRKSPRPRVAAQQLLLWSMTNQSSARLVPALTAAHASLETSIKLTAGEGSRLCLSVAPSHSSPSNFLPWLLLRSTLDWEII